MSDTDHPFWASADNKRRFAAFPVAVVGYIMDEQGRFLMFRLPEDEGWQVVCGGLEAGETPLEGVLRECREEAGDNLTLLPLGSFHSYSYEYDEKIRRLLCISFLLKYEGGEPVAGDDFKGAEYSWVELDDIVGAKIPVKVPVRYNELFVRAAGVFKQWQKEDFRVDYKGDA